MEKAQVSKPNRKINPWKQDKFPINRPSMDLPIPKPRRPHVTLTQEHIMDRPVIVVGDVHGCLEELKELVDKVHETHPDCFFVFCGDLVNKGPFSVEALRYVRSLGPSKAVSIRGNHEDHVINKWLSWQRSQGQRSQGQGEEPRGMWKWCMALTADDIAWLQELPYTLSIPHLSSIIVHAGFVPCTPLIQQHPWDMTEMKDLIEISQSQSSKPQISQSKISKPKIGQSNGSKSDDQSATNQSAIQLENNQSKSTKSQNDQSENKKPEKSQSENDQLQFFQPTKVDNGNPWACAWEQSEKHTDFEGLHVYFGHDSRRGLQEYKHSTGLDTGCVKGGYLTAKYLTGDKSYVTVKARQAYYVKKRK